jgi:phage tail-like protein
MNIDTRDPFVNARFRVEIDGLQGTGATDVVFPEARIIDRHRKTRRVVQYGSLTLRRGLSFSGEWYQWWDRARGAKANRRTVNIVLMDAQRADVVRWTFVDALPIAYVVSPLRALGNEPLLETLEVSVGGLTVAFVGGKP